MKYALISLLILAAPATAQVSSAELLRRCYASEATNDDAGLCWGYIDGVVDMIDADLSRAGCQPMTKTGYLFDMLDYLVDLGPDRQNEAAAPHIATFLTAGSACPI